MIRRIVTLTVLGGGLASILTIPGVASAKAIACNHSDGSRRHEHGPARGQGDDGHGGEVLPLKAHAFGTSYEKLAEGFVGWALQGPNNPILDTDGRYCALGQSGPVWYLGGTFGGAVVRSCTIPEGKSLFFPVFDGFWVQYPTDPYTSEQQIHAILNDSYFSHICDLWTSIDGREVENVWDYFKQSHEFAMTLGANNIGPGYAGTFSPTVNDGWQIWLTPLSKGKHVIEFGGTMDCGLATETTVAATYHLTIAN